MFMLQSYVTHVQILTLGFKFVAGLVAKVAKFYPLILCLVVADRIVDFFLATAEAECSDDLTNSVLREVGDQVSSALHGFRANGGGEGVPSSTVFFLSISNRIFE